MAPPHPIKSKHACICAPLQGKTWRWCPVKPSGKISHSFTLYNPVDTQVLRGRHDVGTRGYFLILRCKCILWKRPKWLGNTGEGCAHINSLEWVTRMALADENLSINPLHLLTAAHLVLSIAQIRKIPREVKTVVIWADNSSACALINMGRGIIVGDETGSAGNGQHTTGVPIASGSPTLHNRGQCCGRHGKSQEYVEMDGVVLWFGRRIYMQEWERYLVEEKSDHKKYIRKEHLIISSCK